jgi:hypothetical protein
MGIAAAGAGLVTTGVGLALLPAGTEAAVPLSAVVVFITALYMLWVVLCCEFHAGTFRLGFPVRMFTLPVRTRALVAWPMAYGIAAAALLWAAAAVFVWLPAGIEPTGWLVPLLVVSVVWFQAICWAVPGPPLAKVAALCVAFPALKFALEMISLTVVLYVNHESPKDGTAVARARPVILTVFATAFIPLAYAVALTGVSRARRGAAGGSLPGRESISRVLARLPRARFSFRSPVLSQLWFEWLRKGAILPLFATAFLAFLAAVVAPVVPPAHLVTGVMILVALVIVVAFFVGYGFGKTNFWASELRLSEFHATRPLGSGHLAAAKIGAAALSAAVTTAVVGCGVAVWLGLLGQFGKVVQWAHERSPVFDSPFAGPVGAVVLFVLICGQLIGGLVPSLAGRTWVVNGVVAAYLAVAAGLGLLVRHVISHPDVLEPVVAEVSWAARVAVGAKLVSAVFAARAACRRELLTGRAVGVCFAAWCAAAGGLFALAYSMLPAGVRPLAVIGVLLVPLVRVLLAAPALAWNRHR